jgi:HAD superfamily hydrolase (TIGR01509 family)
MKIKNIIFDLGAVLLNLDMLRTEAAFAALIGDKKLHQSIQRQLFEQKLFSKFETNEIKEAEFIETLKSVTPHPLNEKQIRTAWSAMLLDFPASRIEFLKNLKSEGYKIFLLSNINSIHLEDVYANFQEEHGNLNFDGLFDKPYYSHLIGRRKPDSETYLFVLEDAGIEASQTLFIDDNADNISGAKKAGLHTIHHQANGDIEKVVKDFLKLQVH